MDSNNLFIKFHYPELKEIIFQFLTLSSGILAFSVVFAEKLAEKGNRKSRGTLSLLFSWMFFIASLVVGGIGLVRLVIAGDFAYGGEIISRGSYYFGSINSIEQHLVGVYLLMFVAGMCFVIGLALLAVAAFIKLFRQA